MILKKTIDIVKHISCAGTSAPTAFPTAFPTTSPTSLSNTPTSFPTRAPTAVPTGAPTANPTAALSCTSGTWMFMSKVFANPDRFGVPAYADGVVYNIPTTMGPDTCAKIETSHSNVGSEGVIQTIMHQYKCCGNSGRIYGAISMDSNPTPYPTAYPTPVSNCGADRGADPGGLDVQHAPDRLCRLRQSRRPVVLHVQRCRVRRHEACRRRH